MPSRFGNDREQERRLQGGVTACGLLAVVLTAGLAWAPGAAAESADDVDIWLELEIAIRTGDAERVQSLTREGFDLDGFDPEDLWERTPLLLAAKYGQPEITALLLAAGADPNRPDGTGKSPLLIAVKAGSRETARVLTRNGAHLDAGDAESRTPLFWAIGADDEATVEMLLKAGADPNVPFVNAFTDEKHSLLWYARRRDADNPESGIVRLLESHGARDLKGE